MRVPQLDKAGALRAGRRLCGLGIAISTAAIIVGIERLEGFTFLPIGPFLGRNALLIAQFLFGLDQAFRAWTGRLVGYALILGYLLPLTLVVISVGGLPTSIRWNVLLLSTILGLALSLMEKPETRAG